MKRKRTRTQLAGGLFFCFLSYRGANDSEMRISPFSDIFLFTKRRGYDSILGKEKMTAFFADYFFLPIYQILMEETTMKMIFQVEDKPKFGALVVFAIQQLLAIMAATLVVPIIVGNGMSSAAALFGAGVGTLVYVLFTAKKSPVFLGSSFAFIGSMSAAFAGATTMGAGVETGYVGLIIGAVCAGLVYVVIAAIVKVVGVK